MAEETAGVKITQNAIYAKQLEHGETLIKILQKLDHLDDVPDRLREVELTLARLAWIEKIAYTGLSAALVAITGLIISMIGM
ncbi:hypothetical protein UFOVP332_17 [uncultured Caudovirales phage]|jgi:hypothetical protein|uniref:Uncharacterized protein n=1 Tax=uncultured Caudovirales phage TaxID=2100421 RepID=A0A6J5LV54_9CAUD|nr:hypothetical protein UFOVP332_17 [uncultured Caudovirales phage]